MNKEIELVVDSLRSAMRYRWIGLGAACLIGIAGALVVLAMPGRYLSRAQIYVDTRSVLKPLLQGLAVAPQPQDQADVMRRALMARPSLDKVAQITGLYAGVNTPEAREQLMQWLENRITIGGDAALGIYTIAYSDENAAKAQQVVQALLDTFVASALGAGRADTASAAHFLEDQVAEYERRLSESERKLADFKKRHVGQMPDQRGDYFGKLQAETSTNEKLHTDLAVARRQRDELQAKLVGDRSGKVSPGPIPTSQEIQLATALDARIRDNKKQLDELLLKYTDKHPEVIALRDMISRLQEQRQVQLGGVRPTNGVATSESSVPVDPVLQNLQIELNSADVRVASLEAELGASDARLKDLRDVVSVGPEIESELTKLNRDYGVTKTQYEALFQRLQSANLSSEADRREDVRFKVVEPPTAPLRPSTPKRGLMLLGVLVLALAGGVAIAYACSLARPVYLGPNSMGRVTDLPVIGVISLSRSDAERSRAMLSALAFAASVAGFVIAMVAIGILNFPLSELVRGIAGLRST